MDGAQVKKGGPQKGHNIQKDVMNALFVAVLGFLMLNLTFVLYAGAYNLAIRAMRMGSGEDVSFAGGNAAPMILRVVLVMLIVLFSWLMLKSKFNVIFKASFLMVPVATVLVTIGISLNSTPVLVYVLCGLVCASLLYWLFRNKWHWLYMYSVLIVATALTLMGILGLDI